MLLVFSDYAVCLCYLCCLFILFFQYAPRVHYVLAYCLLLFLVFLLVYFETEIKSGTIVTGEGRIAT